MKTRTLLFALLLGLPVVATANPDNTKAPLVDAKKLSDLDTQIIAHQHAVNMAEVDMGKLAQSNGGNAVNKYGTKLVIDHSKADKDAMTFAEKHGLKTIPDDTAMSDADKKDQASMVAKLKGLNGADFDHEFLNMMVGGHEREITKIEADIAIAENRDLVKMLKTVKPVLQGHLDSAKTLQRAAQTSSTALSRHN
jgi:putative membrane protein